MEITNAVMAETRKEIDVQSLANQYLMNALGRDYRVADGFLGNGHWYFRIVYHCATVPQALGVGKLLVDAATGIVIPLSPAQFEDARNQVLEHHGEAKGILGPTARRHIQGYLTNYVSLFAEPDRPIYHDENPPIWRAAVFLRLRGQGRVCDLGTIDVNAGTGEVIAVSDEQLQRMRNRVQDAIACKALATTAAG